MSVVNYELPNVPEDYVHRIGRTGRAGLTGEAVSLVCVDEAGLLKDIQKILTQPLQQVVVPGFEPDPRARAQPLAGMGGQRRQGGGGRAGAGDQPRRHAPRRPPARAGSSAANNRRGRPSPR
jgi:ATP-dependent RNA helicase RhlE